jgi:Protein of unknown function (DUF2877)
MRCLAAASSALRPVLAGPAQPALCLGVARGALYLRIARPPGALAVLCHDAVRLPCGLVLPTTGAELPLTSLAAPTDSFLVGDGAVRWTGPAGRMDVRVVREWAPARPVRGAVTASALAAVQSQLGLDESHSRRRRHRQAGGWKFAVATAVADFHPRPGDDAFAPAEAALLPDLAAAAGDHDASVAAAAGLLGRGPGLTPSGDDVLAGYLAGAAAFGLDATALRRAVAVLAPARTTALSAALLWHAARGQCIDELAAVAAVLASQPRHDGEPAGNVLHQQAERAVSRLLRVGHSSGAALARGLVIAAESALCRQAGRAA